MLACFAAIGRGDPATLDILLRSYAQDPHKTSILSDPLEQYFVEHEPTSDKERLSSFLVMLAYGKLVDAYILQKQLPAEHQQWTREELTSIFESEIAADLAETEVPADTARQQTQILLGILLDTLEAATTAEHLDDKAAFKIIQSIDQYRAFPRLDDLLSMITLYIEERNQDTMSLPNMAPDWQHSAS